LFTYDVISINLIDSVINKDFTKYSNTIFKSKKQLPIVLPNDVVEIQTGINTFKKLSEYKDNFSLIIDTGNSEYTRISEKVHKLVSTYDKVNDRKIKLKIKSLAGIVYSDTVVTFNLKIYNDIYRIVAIVDKDTDTDILIGIKSGINLFFKNKLIIDKIHDVTNNNIEKYCLEFIKKIDFLLNKFFDECYKLKYCINSNMIDNFFLKFLFYCTEYSHNLNLCEIRNENQFGKEYKKLLKNKKYDLIKVLLYLKNKYKFVIPEKYINFYELINDDIFESFIDEHLLALEKITIIKNILSFDRIAYFSRKCKIKKYVITKYKSFDHIIDLLMY
jgi:hypothetical protein